jgi:uncharacterized protein (DUF2336 family)
MRVITAPASEQAPQTAMMPFTSDDDFAIHSIEAAIAQSTEHRRAEHLRRVTDLFVSGAALYSDGHIAVFDRVLQKLIEQIEVAVLAEVGAQLAPIARAPLGVMRILAHHDEIAVARPVLTRFERLPTADLRDIAETKGQAHLMAICNRSRLEEAVTDVLVRRGNGEVVRTLAANDGARFSESGMGRLAERAVEDETLAENVVRRADLPHHIFCRLLVAASSNVRARLLTIVDPELRDEACRVLDKVSGEIADEAPRPRSYGVAIRRVLLDTARRQLSEDDLLEYATNHEVDETVAALSLLSSVPTEKIEHVLTRAQYETLLIICKAAGLTWVGARAVLLLKSPRADLSSEALAELQQRFEDLELSQANHIVQMWSLNA